MRVHAKEYLKDKKVVVMGLGVFGGGVASAKFCLKHGATVLVTDLRDEKTLMSSLKQFTPKEYQALTFVFGKHRKSDFKKADIIVVNPGVPRTSQYLAVAKESGAILENDTSLFFRFAKRPTIGITGTRGKTTTANWIAQLLSTHLGNMEAIGNSSKHPLLSELSKKARKVGPCKLPHIAELSSWQLELLPQSKRAPHIALITNIYPDHLNRYRDIKDYANAKAHIFKYQTPNDLLILNYDSNFRDFYLQKNPTAKVYFFSLKKLPKTKNGVFLINDDVILQEAGTQKKLLSLKAFKQTWGTHNTANLLTALLAIHLYNPRIRISQKQLHDLAEIPYRQQTVHQSSSLRIVNDSTATSPDGLIAAIKRFAGKDTVFIAGGTKKDVSFDETAREIKRYIPAKHLILLSGSATDDLIRSLKKTRYPLERVATHETLHECIEAAFAKKPTTLIFSPGAASFEKFKNEFDRGESFNTLVKKALKKHAAYT